MAGSDLKTTNLEHQYLVTEPIPELQAAAKTMPTLRDPCKMEGRRRPSLDMYSLPSRIMQE